MSRTKIRINDALGSVSAIWSGLESPRAGMLFAHGAGAGMEHAFMEAMARKLARRNIATLRFQFPYMEQGRRSPGAPSGSKMALRKAWAYAHRQQPDLAWFAGGKSMGGRLSAVLAGEGKLVDLRGLVFFGFPLHAPGKPQTERASQLDGIAAPMLFLQGTRDKLAQLDLITQVTAARPNAILHVVDGADHGFNVLKRSGRSAGEVLDELADRTAAFCIAED